MDIKEIILISLIIIISISLYVKVWDFGYYLFLKVTQILYYPFSPWKRVKHPPKWLEKEIRKLSWKNLSPHQYFLFKGKHFIYEVHFSKFEFNTPKKIEIYRMKRRD